MPTNRDSKRECIARGSTLVAVVVAHGLIIIYALWADLITNDVVNPHSVQVTLIDKPPSLAGDWTLPAMKLSRLKPLPLPTSMPRVRVDVLPEPPPPQAVASEQTADSNAAIVASNGATS